MASQDSSRERNGYDVVPCRPPEVLDHFAVARPREIDDPRYVARVVSHQHDVPCLDRDVRSRPDRDPNVSSHERRRVVYPISDHANPLPRALELLDPRSLLVREHLGEDRVDPKLRGDRLGDRARIACHHHDLDAAIVKRSDCVLRFRSDDVRHRKCGEHASIICKIDGRLPPLSRSLRHLTELGGYVERPRADQRRPTDV